MAYLSNEFMSRYEGREVNWGFASGPNYLGEVTYRRTYSRDKEKWKDTVRRCVEGTFTVLEKHCKQHSRRFDKGLARSEAEQMYECIFSFKFTPPGRGLWMMGTPFIHERGIAAALNNCAFTSTEGLIHDPALPFKFLMDMSMLGVGVGFDVKGAGEVVWLPGNVAGEFKFVIPDSREGWVESLVLLLRWAFGLGKEPVYDDSKVRRAGELIRGFGGVASGSAPLMALLGTLREMAWRRAGNPISVRDIVDINNLLGVCVVAGNVRRTAEIAFGPEEDEFLDLKNYGVNPDRAAYGWTSNNTVFAKVGQRYKKIAKRIRINGEPGVAWLENMRAYSRMGYPPDYKDVKAKGANPCAEQTLEDKELCTLVENYLNNHQDLPTFKRTLKYSYLYAKAVTLLDTHWGQTNEVMRRNRRIGCSVSGVVQFLSLFPEKELVRWLEEGYETINKYDSIYSSWLGVPESIKKSSVKPSGSVSLLAGATPGVHYPTYSCYLRRVRYAKDHPDLPAIRASSYHVEPSVTDPGTMIATFPVKGPDVPTEQDVPLERKLYLAALLQRHWADNQVSCTASFHPEEEGHLIEPLLRDYQHKLKAISFLPLTPAGAYHQMPYEAIDASTYHDRTRHLTKILWPDTSTHTDAARFCDGTACEITR